jgi:uncharacterized delta-60 repeat protein
MRNSSRLAVKINRGGRPALVSLISVLFLFQSFLGLVHAAAGDLDPTFGTGGRVTTSIGGVQDHAEDVAVQPDGKIIAVGSAFVSDGMRADYEFALARYNVDGSLDPSFGAGGKVVTDFFGDEDAARAVAIQGDGKIVVAGFARNGFDLSSIDFALARYNPDGSLDPAFGSAGKVTTDFSVTEDVALDVAIQSDGKIVAAGYVRPGATNDFALARYNANGSLDTTFGSGGKVITDLSGGFDEANAVAIQSDGKIIAAGNSFGDFALARYDTAGNLDGTFGMGGKVTTPVAISGASDSITALAIQSNGKIIAGGFSLSGPGNYDFALARYNADGSLDSGFGAGGTVVTDFFGSNDQANAISLQFNGKIVAVGSALTSTSALFGLVRYNADGSLDPSFGAGGKVTTGFPGGNGAIANAVAIQADGRIVAAGFRQTPSIEEFAVARYFGDAPPCSTICPSSIATSNTPGQCGAFVNYTAPSGAGCGTVACFPPPGSFFPTGTTTVTCAPVAGPACSFTVTVNDTQPTITCPPNQTKCNDPNQCGAVVTFPPPTASDNCPGVTTSCSPASGSFFPKGTTTVTCTATDSSGNTASCPFTVTVNDCQAPSITCPQSIISVAAASCPIQTTTPPVNFTVTASDNCPGVTVVCKNQSAAVVVSGQTFPVGTTTVTCTATDTSGNTSTCGFTVNGFSFCLQDETNPGNFALINASTGDYSFFCNGVLIASGRGTLNAKSCEGTIEHNKGDRRVFMSWDTTANGGKGAGTAIVQVGVNNTRCQITDKNMQNNTCTVPAPVVAPVTGKPNKQTQN